MAIFVAVSKVRILSKIRVSAIALDHPGYGQVGNDLQEKHGFLISVVILLTERIRL